METIIPIPLTRSFDYSQQEENNFWLVKPANQDNDRGAAPGQTLGRFIQNAGEGPEVICILSAELSSPQLIKWCITMATKGKRVYLLTAHKPNDHAQLAGVCLMRFGLPIVGSMVITDPKNDPKGIFFNCALSDEFLAKAIFNAVDLDSEQCKLGYNFFAYHFWNSAKKEIKERNALVQNCENAPFSLATPKSLMPEVKKGISTGEITHGIFPSSSWKLGTLEDATLVTDMKLEQPELFGKDNDLYTYTNPDPLHCLCTAQNGYLFGASDLKTESIQFILKLNPGQQTDFNEVIENRASSAPYKFIRKVKRVHLIDKKILRLNSPQEQKIRESTTKSERVDSEMFRSKSELEKLEPPFKDDNTSCQLNYEWSVFQFTLPKSANRDPLYQKWDKKQKNFASKIQEMQSVIQKAKEKSQGFASNLMRFMKGILLGKNQKWQELSLELEEFGEKELKDVSRTERKRIVDRLNIIQRDIADSVIELDEKVEEARLQEEWETKKKLLLEEIEKLENEKREVISEIKETEAAFKADLERREKAIQEFLESRKIEPDTLPKYKNELEKKAGAKNRKKNPEEAEKAKKELEELARFDPAVLKKKQTADRKKNERDQQQIENKLSRKKADLDKHGDKFIPVRQKVSGGSSIDKLHGKGGKSSSRSVRSFSEEFPENLPEKGELFTANGKRYLTITYWEEEEKGRIEAERLNAELCTSLNE